MGIVTTCSTGHRAGVGVGLRGGSGLMDQSRPGFTWRWAGKLKRQGLQRLIIALSIVTALGFWALNAVILGPRLPSADGPAAFLRNVALAVTFVSSVSGASIAFATVLRRGYVLRRDVVAGIDRKTVVFPFALSLSILILGVAVSALVIATSLGGENRAVMISYLLHYLTVGAGFALMGSFVGNLAASVVLEACDLGRWICVNLILVISVAAFWIFLMCAVLHLLGRQIGAAVL